MAVPASLFISLLISPVIKAAAADAHCGGDHKDCESREEEWEGCAGEEGGEVQG